MMGPATFVVMLLVGVLIIIGALVLASGGRKRNPNRVCRADGCGHRNPRGAMFCARCGAALNGTESETTKRE